MVAAKHVGNDPKDTQETKLDWIRPRPKMFQLVQVKNVRQCNQRISEHVTLRPSILGPKMPSKFKTPLPVSGMLLQGFTPASSGARPGLLQSGFVNQLQQ